MARRVPVGAPGRGLANVELTVATDIIIPLPAPEGMGVAGAGSAPRPTRTQEAARLKREVRDLRAQLDQVTAEATRLRSALEGAESAAVETAAIVARRDSALAKLEEVSTERDQALEAGRRATAERDEVLRRAGAERDDKLRRATEERDAALADRNRAANELARRPPPDRPAARSLRGHLPRGAPVPGRARWSPARARRPRRGGRRRAASRR